MQKRMKITITILTLVFGGLIVFNLFRSYMIKRYLAHMVQPAVTVSSVFAKKQDWEPRISSVGNLLAINGVDVNTVAAGKVTAVHFNSGQSVEEGAPLIDIDDHIEQAELLSAQAKLTLNELNYKRQTELAKHGATSSSNVDEARATLQQAQGNVMRINARIQQKHITAPFSGRLGIRQVNLGEYVTPGKTSIVTLQSEDPLYLEFYVPEQLYKKIHLNQPIKFATDQNPNLLFEGKITAINSKIDTNTHNIQLQATIPNCPREGVRNPLHSPLVKVIKQNNDGKIIIRCNSESNKTHHVTRFNFVPGMFATIDIEQPVKHNVITLPTVSISHSLYGNSVYRIDHVDKGLVAKRIFVSTGQERGNYTVIKKGLVEGQEVVSAGELKLQDNTPVIINNSVKLVDSDPNQLSE